MRRPAAAARLPSAIAGQRRLADPRRAAEQDERAGHQPAAEHAVELADARGQALHRGRAHVGQRDRLRPAAPGPRRAAAAAGGGAASSTSVFHSPQPGHCPCHLGAACPQCEQTWLRPAGPCDPG